MEPLGATLAKKLVSHAWQLHSAGAEEAEEERAALAALLRTLDGAAPAALDAALNKQLASSAKTARKAARSTGDDAKAVPEAAAAESFVRYLQVRSDTRPYSALLASHYASTAC